MKKQCSFGRIVCDNLAGLAVVAVLALSLASCTATRVVTTTASYVQHGDTTTTIMTKTTETYRGEKQL